MQEIPEEFLSALSDDPEAMQRFSGLPDPEKDSVLLRARGARTRQELQQLISRL